MILTLRNILGLLFAVILVWLSFLSISRHVGGQVGRPSERKPTPMPPSPSRAATRSTPTPTPTPSPTPPPILTTASLSSKPPALRSITFETISLDSKGKEVSRRALQAESLTEDLGNGVKLEMVRIPAGRFTMGSPSNESGRRADEKEHEVTLSAFYIGRYEITQAQWKAVMGTEPAKNVFLGKFVGDQLPVVLLSWNEAKEFCVKLNGLARLAGRNEEYRLPSEAEWEYAARGGTKTPFAFGETITPAIAYYDGNYPYGQAAKGEYLRNPGIVGSLGYANGYGLFDMHGNVWEWCEDLYGEYPSEPVKDPKGPVGGSSNRVLRGGSWSDYAVICRSASRTFNVQRARSSSIGFRLARTA
ncbi:MAG: formylglycine-generating enzyme family protein [Acidobacteria bacterium]|nr:formylglycine-generating enzyme family protein [Acidobacteriota bacterium]